MSVPIHAADPDPMSTSRHTPAEWDALFVRYLASGQTQRAFCEQNDLSFDAFRSRYQKSERFAGKRRRAKPAPDTARPGSGFVAVRTRPAVPTGTAAAQAAAVTIRLASGTAIECPLTLGAETIALIAREVAR